MLILCAILLASAALADASAIKGHARPHEEAARSIKLAPVNNNIDKAASSPSASVPILESTKRIYNDETIRRLAYSSQQPAAAAVVAAAEPQQAPVVQKEPVVAPVAAPVAPVVVPPVPVVQAVPVAPVSSAQVQPVQQMAPVQPAVVVKDCSMINPNCHRNAPVPVQSPSVQPVSQPKVVEAKSAPAEQPAPAKQADELPPQSVRSAEEIVEKVRKVEPVQPAAANQQPVQVQVQPVQAAPVEPAVPKAADELPPQSDRSAIGGQQVAEQPVRSPVVEQPVAVVAVQQPAVQVQPAAQAQPVAVAEPLHIEVPAPDPGLVLSEPIDSTTKLLIDLDEHVRKFLPAEEQQQPAQPSKDQILVAGVDYSPPAAVSGSEPSGKSSAPLMPYSSATAVVDDLPPLPSLESVEKASAGAPVAASGSASSGSGVAPASSGSAPSGALPSSATRQGGNQHQNQQQVITQLLDQLDTLQNRIQDTINQLVARRRYVMSALLRPMGTYVRRVRTNLERLQNRVNQLQAAAQSMGGGGNNRPGGFVDAAAIETIRRRIDDISKRISDIVNRIRFSLTPTSAPLNSNGRK